MVGGNCKLFQAYKLVRIWKMIKFGHQTTHKVTKWWRKRRWKREMSMRLTKYNRHSKSYFIFIHTLCTYIAGSIWLLRVVSTHSTRDFLIAFKRMEPWDYRFVSIVSLVSNSEIQESWSVDAKCIQKNALLYFCEAVKPLWNFLNYFSSMKRLYKVYNDLETDFWVSHKNVLIISEPGGYVDNAMLL